MKVRIDDRWTLEQTWLPNLYRTPQITIRDDHSYSRLVTRETDEFLFNFLDALFAELDDYEE